MATASHPSPDASAPVANSPRSKRAAVPRGAAAPPPWSQLVRGGAESEPLDAAPSSPSASRGGPIGNSSPDRGPISSSSSPDHDAGDAAQADCSDGNAGKKQVWNKPSNGAVEVVGGAVMGAESWPALSESTKASSLKSASSDSLKPPLSDPTPVSAPQGAGISSSSAPKSAITSNANPTATPTHVLPPSRQKSMKKVGGSSSGNTNANGGFPQPLPPSGQIVEMPSTNAGRSGLAFPESSPRDHTNKESGQRGGFGSQSHGGNENPQQRNSFRRGNGSGPYPRGDGSYQQNRGRRDQDGGNHEWNSHRSFSGRDAPLHPQRVGPRGFIRPPPHNPTPFIPPPPVPVQPFGSPIIYPEIPPPMIYVPAPHPDSFRGMPVVAQMPPHAMFFPIPDQLRPKIMNQIDYYFSNENLIRDTYLRRNMDEQGWVPISLIAGFAKVKLLTDSIPLILDALRYSNVVEVKDEKVRKREDGWKWHMPSVQFPNVSGPQSLGRSSHDMLAANIGSMSLDENMNKQGHEEGFLSRSSSGESNSQSQRFSGEGTDQAAFQAGESSFSATRSK